MPLPSLPTARRAAAARARDQHGRLTTAELNAAGLDWRRRAAMVRAGALLDRGSDVWCLTPEVVVPHADLHEAVLKGGPDGVAVDASAWWLWGWRDRAPARHVIGVPRGSRRARADVGWRERRRPYLPGQVTRHHGIPVTTPAWTVVEAAAALDGVGLDLLVHAALTSDYLKLDGLRDAVDAAAGARGIRALRGALDEADGRGLLRSPAERELRRLVDEAGLGDGARFNHEVLGRERDCVWPELRLVVEVVSFAFHATPHALDDDLRRDAGLQAAGWTVHPVSARMLRTAFVRTAVEPGQVVARLRAAAQP